MTWPPAIGKLQSWRDGSRPPVRSLLTLRASWLEQGSSLQHHPLLRVHLELALQRMQLPCYPKHPSDKPAVLHGSAGGRSEPAPSLCLSDAHGLRAVQAQACGLRHERRWRSPSYDAVPSAERAPRRQSLV